jgi:hypothetical protein
MLQRAALGPVSLLVFAHVFLIISIPSTHAGEESMVYKGRFVSEKPISGSIRITFPAGEINPVSAYLELDSGQEMAATFDRTQNQVSLKPFNQSIPISRIVLLLQKIAADPGLPEMIVEAGGRIIPGSWDDLPPLLLGDLTGVTDSLSLATVAAADTHEVGFNTVATPVSDSGIIWVTFPSGFDIAGIDTAIYSDDDSGNDGNEPVISSIIITDQTVQFQLNEGALPADAPSRISVKTWPIANDTVAQNYTVVVMTTDSTGIIENGPAVSEEFLLQPGPLDHIIIMPDTALSIPADSIITFDVSGNDQYENEIDTLIFTYDVTEDSCGDVVDGVFMADKVGPCYVTASADGITDSSGLITVVPGPLDHFSISGTPSSRTAGQQFPSIVNVTAYDVRVNIKTDYLGAIWFESSDPAAVLLYDSGNPYTYVVDDSGSADFAGTGFELRTAGSQTVTATNGTILVVSAPIEVGAALIDTFTFSVGQNQNAGESFDLQVLFAEDEFGNPASDNVLISTAYGGGSSPDGIPPALNNVTVIDGYGLARQILTNAVPTVLRGSAGGAVVETDTIIVHPGFRGRFEMSGYPDSTIAGATFADSVTATVFDVFGNLKTNYVDSVYFTSSDSLADLPYTDSSKYEFVTADSGSHSFDGSGFSLKTAGEQILTITDDVIFDTSETITVDPGQINEFIIFAPPTPVTAGIPFMVRISECRDSYGNLANGTVNVADSVGGGASPDSTQPVYNSIQVVSGLGSANQTLVNAVTTVLKGTSGAVVGVTDSITVNPGSTGEFDLNISSPQISGFSFTGTAEITAFDQYGNQKSDYDASVDTVVVESSASGTMQNNIFNLAGDFINGVVDLVVRGTRYDGRGGVMTFSATSESGVIGISDPVVMRAIFCDTLIINEGVVSWGDTATGVIIVSNDGEVAVEITDLDVFTESGGLLEPIVTPGLPDSIQPGLDETYDISIPIHDGFALGVHPLSATVEGLFGAFTVTDTLSGFPDTLEIQSASQVGYVGGSISRDTLSSGEYYALSLKLSNSGTAGLGLIDSSYLYFTDGTRDFMAEISSGVYLPPGTPSGTLVILDSSLVDPNFISGIYELSFHYFGRENGNFLSGIIVLSDSITVQSGVDISYLAGSQNIDSLVLGQNAAFAVRVRNNGTASLTLDHEITKIRFSDSVREFVAYSDTSSSIRVDVIIPGDTTLYFDPTILSPEFTPDRYLPQVTIRGVQNGNLMTIIFETEPDSVDVLSRGTLRIDTTYVMSLNAPFVNTAQDCSVKVALSNQGAESLDSIYVHLTSDGASVFPESLLVTHVDGMGATAISYPVTAAVNPDSGEVFAIALSGGVGNISGMPPLILPPLDNAALLIIERAAELSLSAIGVADPPEAMDDTVTVSQPVRISAQVNNLGQADITGSQRLVLDLGSSGFNVADSVNRDYILDQDVFWDLTAPSDPSVSAILTVRFFQRANDSNDGSDAVGPDSVSTRQFVVETTPYLQHHPVISDPLGATDGIISTDQTFILTDTISAFGTYANLSASIILTPGFTTEDSLVKHPTGNTASWNIRAPAGATQDSIGILSWLYDVNTGDSISAGPDFVEATVVEAAVLNLGTQIVGPQAALDGIIEPGAYLQYEALVINDGQAGVGTGRLSLHLGHPDMIPAEETERDFAPGIPITWTITVPDREISNAIPIWVTLDSIPDDENTGAPAPAVIDSSSIFVTIRELLPRLELTPGQLHSGSVVKGQQLNFMSFSLSNNDRGGAFYIGVTQMMFSVESNPPPNSGDSPAVLTGAAILVDSTEFASTEITAGEIRFDFSDTLDFAPGESADFSLWLNISSNSEVMDFAVSLDSRNIEGVVMDGGVPTAELNAVSRQGTPLLWNSDPTAVLERSFAGSVTSYPNPFNPRNGAAKIGYYLAADSDLELKIFTLLGELVWSKEIQATASLGSAGLHTGHTALQWNAVNDSGSEIRSGVYICIIRNKSTGEEERFKIAVVK